MTPGPRRRAAPATEVKAAWDDLKDIDAVAARLGVSRNFVRGTLKRLGVPVKRPYTRCAHLYPEILRLEREGVPQRQIAARLGCSFGAVQHALRKAAHGD